MDSLETHKIMGFPQERGIPLPKEVVSERIWVDKNYSYYNLL